MYTCSGVLFDDNTTTSYASLMRGHAITRAVHWVCVSLCEYLTSCFGGAGTRDFFWTQAQNIVCIHPEENQPYISCVYVHAYCCIRTYVYVPIVWWRGAETMVIQWRRQDIREGGAGLYARSAREIFDHAPSLTVKVEVHDVEPCAFWR